jgi:cell pole-organizing protein PopZ
MNQSAKAQEPSMEEILASIRRIIADDDTGKAAKPPEAAAPKPAAPPPAAAVPSRPAPVPPPAPRAPPPRPAPPPATANNQNEIDAMLADLEAPPKVAAAPVLPKPVPAKPAVTPPSDVLDLTEAMATPSPGPAPSFRTIDGASDVVFTDPPEQRPEPAARIAEDPRRQPAPAAALDQGLISNSTVSAVDSAFNSLAMTVLGNNARTLEDLVKEMLRPMLKGWLDDNLPGLVERIVRTEIERVSRGRP